VSVLSALFARKAVADREVEGEGGLRRELGAGDLVMLSIGAVIGAGIFSAIGDAAAGEITATGQVVRYGAGPALILSFILLGVVCAFAALCYAELAAMIPKAGSAYAYSYAAFGELIAWIIGWDLILEYAVGNVYVAISWSGYFLSLISPLGISFPPWMIHGYREVLKSSDPAIHGLMETAPHIGPIPVLVNIPAFIIVALITALLYIGVKETKRANNIMVGIKLLVLALFVVVGAMHLDFANYKPFAPNGFRGIHQGAAVVFFAYIGFDAVSTAGEETRDPQKNMPRGILWGLAICTVIYVIVGAVATGLVPYMQLKGSDPLAAAFTKAGLTQFSWIISLGAVVSMTAVLLVFQYGQPRIFMSMARDGLLPKWASKIHPKFRTPHVTTVLTGVFVATWALIGDGAETLDLTNIGTLSAFAVVCLGVIALRYIDPSRHRPFRVAFAPVVGVVGAAACLFVMWGLPHEAWRRFGIWMVIGLVLYAFFGFRNSVLRNSQIPPS
jgi:APA family basic amino acid/polyamine antiporter